MLVRSIHLAWLVVLIVCAAVVSVYAADDSGSNSLAVAALERRVESYNIDMKWEKLVDALSELIQKQPSDPSHYELRGETYLRLREYDKAMADFEKLIEMSKQGKQQPRYVSGDVGRARVLAAQGKKDEALKAFDEAISVSPKWRDTYMARGEMYLAAGDGNKAQADFAKAIELSNVYGKNRAKARMDALEALYWAGQKDIDQALKLANDATIHDPRYEMGFRIQAQLRAAQPGQIDGAINALDRLIKLAPKDPDGYVARGQLLAAKQDVNGAINDFLDATELRPNDPGLWAALAEQELKAQDTEGAIESFEKVQELKPDNAQTKLVLAVLYAVASHPEEDSNKELQAGLAIAKPEDVRNVISFAEAALKKDADSKQLKQVVAKLKAAVAKDAEEKKQ